MGSVATRPPFALSDLMAGLHRDGSAEVFDDSHAGHPSIDGLTVGAARMTHDPPHGGERHPDGDELLYLVSGAVDVVLEESGGERTVALESGQAFIVPRGLWHRVHVRAPSHLVFLTPGPGAEHRPLPTPAGGRS
ncbi:MAG: cupin domain-containing protein [Acidimicrobiia bacterium]|jgi:mannose-6-phosphate isomerase-like protein (cupin superfamily)|nr:cupin domain-containing protein [Acidimicrobiia bacterium]